MVAAFRAPHHPLGEIEAPRITSIRVPDDTRAPLLITLGLGPESAYEVSLNPCFCPKLRQVILSLGALNLKLNDLALKLTDPALMVIKTLSENRQVEQYVGTGQLNQCQPVLRLLGPASAEAAALGEPGDRPLHHPSPRRMRLARGVLLL
jgi:hypothetical protein